MQIDDDASNTMTDGVTTTTLRATVPADAESGAAPHATTEGQASGCPSRRRPPWSVLVAVATSVGASLLLRRWVAHRSAQRSQSETALPPVTQVGLVNVFSRPDVHRPVLGARGPVGARRSARFAGPTRPGAARSARRSPTPDGGATGTGRDRSTRRGAARSCRRPIRR